MPSAYVLAKDQIEQARAMLSNEVWHDAEIEALLERTIARLIELDRRVYEYAPPPPRRPDIAPGIPVPPESVLLWGDP